MNLRQILRELDDEKPPQQGKAQQPKQRPDPSQQPPQGQEPDRKKPEPKKDESLKYEGKYFNGGFADGVKIQPVSGGKLALSISIYGGGEPKKVNIPASGKMAKVLQAYEVGFKSNDRLGPSMEPEIDQYLETLNQQISFKVMAAMREFDQKVKQIIQQTIKGM